MKYTINFYDEGGKYTLMQPFAPEPFVFASKYDAKQYAKQAEMNMNKIKFEEYKPEEWNNGL